LSGRAASAISVGGSHDSGSISFANNTHNQRASSRSVFARSIRPRSAFRLRRIDQPLPQHALGLHVQRARQVIDDEQVRVTDECPGRRDALDLPAR